MAARSSRVQNPPSLSATAYPVPGSSVSPGGRTTVQSRPLAEVPAHHGVRQLVRDPARPCAGFTPEEVTTRSRCLPCRRIATTTSRELAEYTSTGLRVNEVPIVQITASVPATAGSMTSAWVASPGPCGRN
jgi:hypothetical protein